MTSINRNPALAQPPTMQMILQWVAALIQSRNSPPPKFNTGPSSDYFHQNQSPFTVNSGYRPAAPPSRKAYTPPVSSYGSSGSSRHHNHYHPPAYYAPPDNGASGPVDGSSGPSQYSPSGPVDGSSGPSQYSPSGPVAGSSGPTQTGDVTTAAVNGGGPKELVLKNSDSKPMTIALFENTGPGMNPNIDDPNHKYTLQPGQTIKLSMPSSWQGRAQKLSGNPADPATWAEINFENKDGKDKLWFDESLIRGYNSAVTMTPTHGGASAGINKSIINGAPAGAVKTDAGGNTVLDATESYTGGVNTSAEAYYNQAVGNSTAYVRNWDNNAVRTSEDNSLTVDFSAA